MHTLQYSGWHILVCIYDYLLLGETEPDKQLGDCAHLTARALSAKRPRSASNDVSCLEDNLSVQVEILDDDDGLELGDPCKKSRLQGREGVPEEVVRDGIEEWGLQAGGDSDSGDGRLLDRSGSGEVMIVVVIVVSGIVNKIPDVC